MIPFARAEALTPHRWQLEARDAFRNFAGPPHAMVVAATGAGKTVFAHLVAEDFLDRGQRVLMLAHREELVRQPKRTLARFWPHVYGGIIRQKDNEASAPIVYASKDTLRRPGRLEQYLEYGPPALVIVDEAHHSVGRAYRELIERLKATGARLLGITATPDRDDMRRLSDLWEIVYTYSILDAIQEGVVVRPYAAVEKLPELDLSDVPVVGDDFDPKALERALLEQKIVEHTVRHFSMDHVAWELPFRNKVGHFKAMNQNALVFTVTVNQAQLTADALVRHGVAAAAVWGDMRPRDRAAALERFEAGELDALVSPAALTEGTDLPRAKVAYLARATRSWRLFVQIAGRIGRVNGKDTRSLLVDLVGASAEHSLISAPVLVDPVGCPESDDGSHRFYEIVGTNEGRCLHCGKIIKCFLNSGGHKFRDGNCKLCGAVQCAESPDRLHHFVQWGRVRICIHCTREIPDPMYSVMDRSVTPREPVAWKRLAVPGEVWAVELGTIGILFNVNKGDGWSPCLWTRNRMTWLSPLPVPSEHARMLTDDVARRATKVRGFFGGTTNLGAQRLGLVRAEHIANRFKLGG